MITAVDTNVLLDIFTNDVKFGVASANALKKCLTEGTLIACEIVWAETCSAFNDIDKFSQIMASLQIQYISSDVNVANHAGYLWRKAKEIKMPRRNRVMADFIVAAHAMKCADRLLTRDRGFYKNYFGGLKLIQPATTPLP